MINDIVRFLKGDSPACQFEAGQQKGRHFFCTSYFMQKKRNYVTARSNRKSEKHNNLTDQITKTAKNRNS